LNGILNYVSEKVIALCTRDFTRLEEALGLFASRAPTRFNL